MNEWLEFKNLKCINVNTVVLELQKFRIKEGNTINLIVEML